MSQQAYTPPESSYTPEADVTHTRENALDAFEFELLVDASYDLDPVQDLESQFILFVCGRLGLRRGEVTHIQEDWINWRKQRIEIPYQEPCNQGRDGKVCGHCRQKSKQKTRIALRNAAQAAAMYHSDIDQATASEEADLQRELEKAAKKARLSVDEVLEIAGQTEDYEVGYNRFMEIYYDDLLEALISDQWVAKTENAEREVPYGWNARSEIVIERYFDRFDQWMYSGQSANRRLNWLCERVDEVDGVSPHDLRGTAASHLAAKGLDVLQMMAMFGWAQASTARDYIANSPDQLDRQLQFLLS